MTEFPPGQPVKMAFEERTVRALIADIQPLRAVGTTIRKSMKYAQIRASIGEVGVIEPPVVWPLAKGSRRYLLLDGHLRIAALKELGQTEVVCLISTDDEAFTYNRHISRLATIQEHKMVLKAVQQGVPSERIMRVLNIDTSTLRRRIRLLDGICPEAADILKDKHVPGATFDVLRRMLPYRQIEVAENMTNMNCFTVPFAHSLLAATPQSDLVDSAKPKRVRGLTAQQMALMERESANLEREYRTIEQSHGSDHLDLVIAAGYMRKLLGNAAVVRYLAQHHAELLPEFQKLIDIDRDAAAMNGASPQN
jgi:hypothetical protein